MSLFRSVEVLDTMLRESSAMEVQVDVGAHVVMPAAHGSFRMAGSRALLRCCRARPHFSMHMPTEPKCVSGSLPGCQHTFKV